MQQAENLLEHPCDIPCQRYLARGQLDVYLLGRDARRVADYREGFGMAEIRGEKLGCEDGENSSYIPAGEFRLGVLQDAEHR